MVETEVLVLTNIHQLLLHHLHHRVVMQSFDR